MSQVHSHTDRAIAVLPAPPAGVGARLLRLHEAATHKSPSAVAKVAACRRELADAIPELVAYVDVRERLSRDSFSFVSHRGWSEVAGELLSAIRELRTLLSVAQRLVEEDRADASQMESYCGYLASCVEDWMFRDVVAATMDREEYRATA